MTQSDKPGDSGYYMPTNMDEWSDALRAAGVHNPAPATLWLYQAAIAKLPTRAAVLEVLNEATQIGAITGDQARELLEPPERVDPLVVRYDGVTLRELVARDADARQESSRAAQVRVWSFTPIQRAAVSAHWSAQLRAKVAASKERERCQVVLERDAEDVPW